MRCEKNSMGRCRTFHMNDELDTTAIFPSRRSMYMAFSTSTTMRTAPTAISKAMKGYSHSGFFPPSSRSMNTWESAGLMMPTTAVTAAVMATNASAAREPCRRGPPNSHTARGLPLGWKSGPGTKRSMTPVKAASNSSSVTVTSPRAGSFRCTLPPLKPRHTTKWLKFQWTMQGNTPCERSASGCIRKPEASNP